MSFTVDLPMPMSVNNLFRNVPGRGRVKTKAYENWQQTAIKEIWAQVRADRRIGGKVTVTILLPRKCRLDIDNACKPLLDALVHSRRIDDDKHVERLTVLRGHHGERRGLTALWSRFHIWRAMRLYRLVMRHEADAREAMARADRLMVKHAEPPQPRLPLGDDG